MNQVSVEVVESYPTDITVYQTVQPSSPRKEFPPPPAMWRLCAWHDERMPPPGMPVTHIMCQMCYDRLDAEMADQDSK